MENNVYTLRAADIPAAAALSAACFGRAAWKESDFGEALAAGHAVIFCSGEEGAPTGYAVFYHAADEGELDSIAVNAKIRRTGAGSALLSAGVGALRAAGVKKLFLEVREGNAPAVAFYEKHGFLAAGVRKRFYDDPVEDAIIMVKILEG